MSVCYSGGEQDELIKMFGADAVSELENGNSNMHEGGGDEEGDC